jgi:spermidine synthase
MSKEPKVIFSIHSNLNGLLKVVDSSGGRELVANGGAMLSCSENHTLLKKNYWGVFLDTLPKYRKNIKKALIFGLGGGVIQNKLFLMYPGIEITTIEYDPLMNDIYNYYFSGDRFEKHNIINMEAKTFVKNNHRLGDFEKQFDLVFVDTFSSFKEKEYDNFNSFYTGTKKFLRDNGLFCVNMIIWTNPMFEESKIYLDKIKTFYKDTEIIFVGTSFGNSNLLTFSSDKINL